MKKFLVNIIPAMFCASLFLGCVLPDTSDPIEVGYWRLEKSYWNIDEGYWDIEKGYEKLFIPYGYFISYRGGWVYAQYGEEFLNYSLHRMRPDGSDKQKIPSDDGLYGSVYHKGWVYYIDHIYASLDYMLMSSDYMFPGQYSKLFRMRLDGSKKTELASDVFSFEIIGEKIYYRSDYSLYRMNIDGSGQVKIIDNCSNYLFAGGYIFATYGGIGGGASQYDTKLMRYEMDGKGEILIESDSIIYSPLFTDSEFLYYILYFGYLNSNEMKGVQLHRMKFDGSNHKTVIAHEGYYTLPTIKLSDGYIFYSRYYNPYMTEIYKIRTDGTNRTLIRCTESYSGSDFDLIGNSIFYTTRYDTIGQRYAGILLHHLSINGEHSIVYDTKGKEFLSGYFLDNHKLYLVLGL